MTLVIWSFGTTLMRLISVSSQYLLFSISFFFTFVTILMYFVITRKMRGIGFVKPFNTKFFFFGLFGYFFYIASLTNCFRAFDNASEPTILNYTWPIFTVIFTGLFFRKKAARPKGVRIIEAAGIAVGFISIIILGTRGDVTSIDIANLPGLGWGLAAGASYGLYSGFSSTVKREEHGIFLLYSIFFGMIFMFAISIPEIGNISSFSGLEILYAAIFGCCGSGLGYILWTKANRAANEQNIDISSVASIMFFLPLTSLLVVSLLLGEGKILKPYFAVSLALLILSSVLCRNASRLFKK